jgi:hypothetical protein
MGHFISTNFDYKAYLNERRVLGIENGYQHLWKTAEGKPIGTSAFTWLNGGRYYSITSNTDSETEIIFTQIGANDPNFNLRNDEAIMFRRKDTDHVFASIIEPHGAFNPTLEYSFNSYSTFEKINVLNADNEYTVVQIGGKNNLTWILLIVNNDSSETVNHRLTVNGKDFEWNGPIYLVKN